MLLSLSSLARLKKCLPEDEAEEDSTLDGFVLEMLLLLLDGEFAGGDFEADILEQANSELNG
jgi:hypothetical protein